MSDQLPKQFQKYKKIIKNRLEPGALSDKQFCDIYQAFNFFAILECQFYFRKYHIYSLS